MDAKIYPKWDPKWDPKMIGVLGVLLEASWGHGTGQPANNMPSRSPGEEEAWELGLFKELFVLLLRARDLHALRHKASADFSPW